MMRRYADTLGLWAPQVAEATIAGIAARDERSWFQISERISRGLKDDIANAPMGDVVRQLQREQVDLIRSLPLEAAQRVQDLALKAFEEGRRSDELEAEIMKTGLVTRNRANLIAVTETGRISTIVTQARATHVGSEGYVWRSAKDSVVRPSHREMEGQFVRWDDPPVTDGMKGHAGCVPRCRCYPEVIIPNINEELVA